MATPEVENRVPGHEQKPHQLSADVVFEILADRHRRATLSRLLERDSSVTIEELADEVVATDGTDSSRDRLRVSFAHNHLPKLAEAGVVEYDPGSGVVEPRPSIDVFEPLLAVEIRPASA